MNRDRIFGAVDHTLLAQDATWGQIQEICDDAIAYHTASVCIPPSYVGAAKAYVGDRMKVCTVVGFPNGYNTTASKVFETEDALENGADEIDMVINIGDLKDRRYDRVLDEIRSIKAVCGEHVLKVIIETCLLTEEEKIKMCQLVTEAGADYIKTSTGFSKAGATFEDIALFGRHIGKGVKMKAAGGIASFEDAEKFLDLGAKRLGTSRIVKLAKAEEDHGQKDVDQEGY
ncbi:MAG: deoxyribose-phosphate aldolase [Hungatella sp.]|jgi:deoxyribose-phosphate aldolase|nr:deoxyribose-phosphate aldolase [Hungatella sp.]